ncbi:DNA polymerase IV [Actinospongicola halichondriae]|uniref:DNA polymerase IV n=1 Tax=Actinospongicola halichondriae TaxID=3236844 RepID=UPI003D3B8F27
MSATVRTILHVDMDAFYASVEQHRRPELRGRPVVVGGTGARGVIAAASYEARAFGVRSAMPSLRAKRLCPDAVFLPGDHALYGEVSGRIMEIFRGITPLVEPLSLDEAFLDVTGSRRLHGDGVGIAQGIRDRIFDQEGLTCSVGVASNKFLAKLATEHGKPRPSVDGPIPGTGITVVRPGDERAFLRPLPAGSLWGVGPKTLEKLQRLGVRTVADIEALQLDTLVRAVGEASGRHLHALAHAIDERPVVPDARPKSIGHEETFAEDIDDRDRLHVHLVRMADAVADRVRHHGLPGRTVSIKVRFGDFSTISRSATQPGPVDSGPSIVRAASALLDQVDISSGVRLLGVSLTNLTEDAPRQMSLDDLARTPDTAPAADGAAWEAVTQAVDAVRERFGTDALRPATLLGDSRASRPGERPWGPDATSESGENEPPSPTKRPPR